MITELPFQERRFHISPDELHSIYKVRMSRAKELAPLLNAAMDEFEISYTAERRNMFLAQIAHESGFRAVSEGLSYKDAGRIRQTFKKYFKSETEAEGYVRNPEKLANYVYGHRMGNTAATDGFKFRGRGGIQITGKTNYEAVGKALKIDFVSNPDLMLDAKVAWRAAAWWWKNQNLNEMVDANAYDLPSTTKKINGGCNGFKDRHKKLEIILITLQSETPALDSTKILGVCEIKKPKPQKRLFNIRKKTKPLGADDYSQEIDINGMTLLK